MMKIGLFGPSGTGKTKMADWISENYSIENVNLSAKHLLWKELGITSHKQILEKSFNDPTWGLDFQGNLSAGRIMELDKRVHSYVTDRTPLDNIVYFLLQSAMHATDIDTDNFIRNNINACLKYYTHMIAFPILKPPVNDGKRIFNMRYQQTVDVIYNYVMTTFLIPHIPSGGRLKIAPILKWEWGQRVEEVRGFISPFNLN